jgi:membrane protein DedA with SNARE-associated domain
VKPINTTLAAISSDLVTLHTAFGGLEVFQTALLAAFMVALLESFALSTLLVPGCLVTVALGVGMAIEKVHTAGCIVGVLLGMWTGDQLSFWMTRFCGAWFRKTRVGSRVVSVFSSMERSPARTLLLAHTCPYLSGLAPAAAGLSTLSYARFLIFDTVGVALGTTWFLGVGAIFGKTSESYGMGLVAGVGIAVLGIFLCLLLVRVARASFRRRGIAFICAGLLEYPAFLLQGLAYRFMPRCKREALEAHRDALIVEAKPGDILLVTRLSRGPWGKPSHAGIIETRQTLIHAFHKVQRQRLRDLPLRDGFLLLRVGASETQVSGVVDFARRQIGKGFRITTTKRQASSDNPDHFSCATFVWAAYKSVGVDLTSQVSVATRFVFPRDFQSSPHVTEVSVAGGDRNPAGIGDDHGVHRAKPGGQDDFFPCDHG